MKCLRDVTLAQVVCQYTAQVMQASFAGAVSESLQRRYPKAINASNVDDTRRVSRTRRFLKQRSNELGKIEDTVEVQGEDSSKSGRGIFIVGRSPVGARVVDQDVELCIQGCQLVNRFFK